jgi:DNA-binding NarL/FixJ family response regulator
MVKLNHRLLTVGAHAPVLERVVPLLQRAEIAADDLDDAAQALARIAAHPYDLIIAHHPLPGTALPYLIQAVRTRGSPCRLAGLIVIADADHEAEALELVGRGINRVIRRDAPFEHLLAAISELLAVAPRINLRAAVDLRLRLHDERLQVRLSTHNVSVTGMLVRGGREFPVGSQLSFELVLPESARLIRGHALVVRHSSAAREGIEGVALRIVAFEGDGAARLRDFLGLPLPLPPEFGKGES